MNIAKSKLNSVNESRLLMISARLLWGVAIFIPAIILTIVLGSFDREPWYIVILYIKAYVLCAPFLGIGLSLASLSFYITKRLLNLHSPFEVFTGSILLTLIYGGWLWVLVQIT